MTKETPHQFKDYAGNVIYEDGSLKRILVDGGYVEGNVYHFYLTDHLGNNRMVVKGDGTPVQTNHYYPFGMAFAETSTEELGKQPYKYNGKELEDKHGLNLYDYAARHMEPAIGRFTTIDPLAEKYYSVSPYAYVGNNPIRRIDPTGMEWVDENSKKYAERLTKNIEDRVSSLDKERKTVADNYVKALKSGNSEKASKLLAEGLEIRTSIEDLQSGVTELAAMGETKDQIFAFTEISGNVGGAEKRGDVL